MKKEDIWNLYFYSDLEIDENNYLSKYFFSLIKRKKKEILNNDEKLSKFALISLFPIYRACNHQGVNLNSEEYSNYDSPEQERLKLIESVIGEKIRDTNHYLDLTGIKSSWFQLSFFIPLSLKFYYLIINSKG